MATKKFRFCCTLKDHDSDVRGLANSLHEKGGILSCSRDRTTKLWIPENNGLQYGSKSSYIGHKKFVSCVAAMEPIRGLYPDGLILTGSNDKTINVYMPFDEIPILSLEGHENVVSNIRCGSNGKFYSSSWDLTARIWQVDTSRAGEGECVCVLSGHVAAVWDIAVVPGKQQLLTASADKSIRLWESGRTKHTFYGHTDCVRGLAVISLSQFLSCSNDASVKRWSIDGDCLQTYYGHKSFVYSIDLFPDSIHFVTSGEDQTVKVWSLTNGNPQQTLPVPAISAWKAIALFNGDLAVGCSDGSIRVFSSSDSRTASELDRAEYEEELSRLALPESGMNLGNIDADTLKGPEALQEKGNKDGQTLLIRKSALVEAYQWSTVEDKWIKVGDVVGSSGSNKSTYKGKEYDYVFTVDILEGAPPLHLPYNLSEDPWFAAQKFLDDNDLSQQFLDTVANFIIDNTKGNQQPTNQSQPSGYADPFTGQGRYTPGASGSSKPQGQADPFTGSGRYMPGASANTNGGYGSNKPYDPMLNPSRYVPSNDAEDSKPKTPRIEQQHFSANNYFPKFGYILFESQNAVSMFNKLSGNAKEAGCSLSADDFSSLQALLVPFNDKDLVLKGVENLWSALSWNSELVLPALDLFRSALVSQKQFFEIACENKAGDLITLLLTHMQTNSVKVNKLLAVRILCNLFCSSKGLSFLYDSFDMIVSTVANLLPSENGNSNLNVAISTLFVNYAVSLNEKFLLTTSEAKDAMRCHCLEICAAYVDRASHLGAEAFFRFLVAIGTFLYGHESAQEKAHTVNLPSLIVSGSEKYSSTSKVVECSKCLMQILT